MFMPDVILVDPPIQYSSLIILWNFEIKANSCLLFKTAGAHASPSSKKYIVDAVFLGGLSLHLNHFIASCMTNYDWPFGTLPFGLFWSNLDTRDLETYPRTYSGHF